MSMPNKTRPFRLSLHKPHFSSYIPINSPLLYCLPPFMDNLWLTYNEHVYWWSGETHAFLERNCKLHANCSRGQDWTQLSGAMKKHLCYATELIKFWLHWEDHDLRSIRTGDISDEVWVRGIGNEGFLSDSRAISSVTPISGEISPRCPPWLAELLQQLVSFFCTSLYLSADQCYMRRQDLRSFSVKRYNRFFWRSLSERCPPTSVLREFLNATLDQMPWNSIILSMFQPQPQRGRKLDKPAKMQIEHWEADW